MNQEKQTILDWYREKQNYIDAPCGGAGKCGKCKVRFKDGAPVPTKSEQVLLSEEELANHIRLACMTEMVDESAFELVGELFELEKRASIITEENPYGIAIDIGSTTLVMSLVNLTSREVIATLTEVNPQRMYGSDVLTRIKLANEGYLHVMQNLVQKALAEMFDRIVAKTHVAAKQIKRIVIVGNTTMLHILQGLSCEGLGVAPFTPVNLSMRKIKAVLCEHEPDSETEVYILPGISVFVGADIVAGIYACDMDLEDKPHMLLDVGTNGEMVVGDKSGFFVTSTAAGPVFEGGNISCGMPSVSGGIRHLQYVNDAWKYQSIGGQRPCGICGTGFVDLIAECLRMDVIDENGTLIDEFFESGYQISLQYEEELVQLHINQSDIRELQMGKGAIRAGMECLLDREKPQEIYLAGAFGTQIDLLNAEQIGLFSEEDVAQIKPVGNTALIGAQKFLFSEDGPARIQRIVSMSNEILLANEPEFYERYIQHMQFTKGDFHY